MPGILKVLRFCFCAAFLLTAEISTAQEIKVRGGFLTDSLQIGESVGYYLVASYPQTLTVLFPDSTYKFEPFEYDRKMFSPTHTVNSISYDSVVYYLRSFEIDKVQHLSLPVFVTTARDCTAYHAATDSIALIELVPNPIDSVRAEELPLKTNTFYEKVFSEFNYIILAIVIGVLLISAIVGWIIFGKRIMTHFRMKRLQKAHLKFMRTYSEQFHQLNSLFSREKAEGIMSLWKKYLEQLEQKPYTKLTTRETLEMIRNEKLGDNLRMIDRAIYGNQTSVLEPLDQLKKFADERFHKKLKEIAHG